MAGLMEQRGSRLRGFLLALAMSAAALALVYLVGGVSPEQLRAEWRAADSALILAAMALSLLMHVLMGGHKLWLVLRGMGVEISLLEAFKLRLGEGPLRLIIPLKGGELAAILFFHRDRGMSVGDATGALAMDRGLNLLANTAWLLAGLALGQVQVGAGGLAAVIGLLALGLVLLLWTPCHGALLRAVHALLPGRAARFADGVLSPLQKLSTGRKAGLLAYTLLFVSRPILICSLVLAAFRAHIPLARVMVYTTLSLFAGMIPGPLLGIGPREAAMQALAGPDLPAGSGVAVSVGFMLTVCMYLVPYLAGVPWVAWFLRRLARQDRGR